MGVNEKPIDVDGLRNYLKPGFDDARELLAEKERRVEGVKDLTMSEIDFFNDDDLPSD